MVELIISELIEMFDYPIQEDVLPRKAVQTARQLAARRRDESKGRWRCCSLAYLVTNTGAVQSVHSPLP